jgi:hypothetical protein
VTSEGYLSHYGGQVKGWATENLDSILWMVHFYLLQMTQRGSGAHPAFYSINKGGTFSDKGGGARGGGRG